MTADRIPITLVTGFLGSGKTTLIAALLRQPAMSGTAVVVNEAGAVGIDDAIFAETLDPGDVVLLANGCLCCAAGDDLASAIWALICRPDRPRRIVVETSGLADPAPALRRLVGDPRVRQATRLDAVLTTVDAPNGLRNLDEHAIAVRQCAFADRRVITKADLGHAAGMVALKERLLALNPGAPVELVSNGAIDAGKLFGASLYVAATGRADVGRWLNLDDYRAQPLRRYENRDIRFSGGAAHDPSVGTWLVEEARPIDWQRLSPRLGSIVARYGDQLLRLKGIIQTAGDPRPLVVHGVQRLLHSPVRLERPTQNRATAIVVIGDKGAQPAIEAIAEALASSVAAEPADPARREHLSTHA
jgi:G3E family GTPase